MRFFVSIFLGILCVFLFSTQVYAQGANTQAESEYYKGEVTQIIQEGKKIQNNFTSFYQTVAVKLLDGSEKGKVIEVEQGGLVEITPQQFLKERDKVVIIKNQLPNGETTYTLLDRYRLDYILYILIGFFGLVIFFSGKRGVGSILGLGISIAIILTYIVPQILAGHDPVITSIIGSLFIMFITIYLAHGFSKKVTVAVISTLIALTLTGLFANWFVGLTRLSGLGSEEAGFLLQFNTGNINMQGLLLAGIIIGALGVLDDITTAQSAAIFELHKADKKLPFFELVKRGYSIGREHISSLVNTLVLAYAGTSLSLFIIFVLNPAKQPYWVILNSEIIVEEVIRTLAGSIGLILAVPITTLLAAWIVTSEYFNKKKFLHFKAKD